MRTEIHHPAGGGMIGPDSVSGMSDGFTVVNCGGLEPAPGGQMASHPGGDLGAAYPLLRSHDMPPSYVQVMQTAVESASLQKHEWSMDLCCLIDCKTTEKLFSFLTWPPQTSRFYVDYFSACLHKSSHANYSRLARSSSISQRQSSIWNVEYCKHVWIYFLPSFSCFVAFSDHLT